MKMTSLGNRDFMDVIRGKGEVIRISLRNPVSLGPLYKKREIWMHRKNVECDNQDVVVMHLTNQGMLRVDGYHQKLGKGKEEFCPV